MRAGCDATNHVAATVPGTIWDRLCGGERVGIYEGGVLFSDGGNT